MNLLIIGAAGAVCTPCTIDILQRNEFEAITLADINIEKLESLLETYGKEPGKVKVAKVDARNIKAVDALVAEHDLVCNGLPYQLAPPVLDACIRYGKNGADFGIGNEGADRNKRAREAGITYVNGCGATPGITNMLAKAGADCLDIVDTINVSFAAFRGFALSPALVNVIMWEFEDVNTERVVYRDGKLIQTGPFSGEREITFPDPIGTQTVYYVPHEETRILPDSLNAREVHTRGCFPPNAMQLVRGLSENGLLTHDTVEFEGRNIELWDLLCELLPQYARAKETEVWGYGLHAEVIGTSNGGEKSIEYWTTHPGRDVWGIPEVYTKNVGLPLSVAMHLFKDGRFTGKGVKGPESFFTTGDFFNELILRGFQIHHNH